MMISEIFPRIIFRFCFVATGQGRFGTHLCYIFWRDFRTLSEVFTFTKEDLFLSMFVC